MTREQMVEELVEYEFQQVTLVEISQMFIKLQREFIEQMYDDDQITVRYNEVFGDAEVVH
jgi:spermidine synthase